MRLSEWRAEAPARAAVETKVVAVLEPVLAALGAGKDPHGWAAWGEDFTTRWQYLVPTATGLVDRVRASQRAGGGASCFRQGRALVARPGR